MSYLLSSTATAGGRGDTQGPGKHHQRHEEIRLSLFFAYPQRYRQVHYAGGLCTGPRANRRRLSGFPTSIPKIMQKQGSRFVTVLRRWRVDHLTE